MNQQAKIDQLEWQLEIMTRNWEMSKIIFEANNPDKLDYCRGCGIDSNCKEIFSWTCVECKTQFTTCNHCWLKYREKDHNDIGQCDVCTKHKCH